MNCLDVTTALACFSDGVNAPVTVVVHYEYRTNATGALILHSTRYTNHAGVPIDVSGGTVTAGQCAVTPPDVEYVIQCDVQGDGSVVEFLRRSITSFDGLGVATVAVTDWGFDKVTPYVVTGTVGACNQDCDPVAAIGVVNTWG